MAKITIEIEDLPDGGVKVTPSPKYEELMMIAKHGKCESSHGYAFCALNAIRKESKSQQPSLIKIPRIRLN
jgi:hypothetical protein